MKFISGSSENLKIELLDANGLADVPIPANDDAIRSIKLIVGKLADAIAQGHQISGEGHTIDLDDQYEDYEEHEEEALSGNYSDPEDEEN